MGGVENVKLKNWQFNIEQLYTIMLKDKLNISEMLTRTMNNNTHSNCICYKQNDFSMKRLLSTIQEIIKEVEDISIWC